MSKYELFLKNCGLFFSAIAIILFGLLIIVTPFCSFVFPTDEEILEYFRTIGCNHVSILKRYRFPQTIKDCENSEDVAFKIFNSCSNKEVIVCARSNPINYKIRIVVK
jgi:hypothetical protein